MAETTNNQEVESSNIENIAVASDIDNIEPDAISNAEKSTAPVKPAVKKTESLESALRRFKKQSLGVISEVRKREAYDKPSIKRKKKSKEARKRNNKKSRF